MLENTNQKRLRNILSNLSNNFKDNRTLQDEKEANERVVNRLYKFSENVDRITNEKKKAKNQYYYHEDLYDDRYENLYEHNLIKYNEE